MPLLGELSAVSILKLQRVQVTGLRTAPTSSWVQAVAEQVVVMVVIVVVQQGLATGVKVAVGLQEEGCMGMHKGLMAQQG
jgi:hypothetical protein